MAKEAEQAGSIREEEVYSTLPYERHLEISRAAQNLVGGVTSFLRNLFVPAVETIKQADVPSHFDVYEA